MSQKLNTPKGTRDFSSFELKKRDYLLNILKDCFKAFNFQEIQTPSFENLTTLTGKYGDEEDNLMFKILSSGDKIKKADTEALKNDKLTKFSNSLSDKALRYDLTVPLSRFVSQNLNNLSFPFKRFQTQLVWRAERPQRGRYREFLQCDVDIVGESNFLNEVECIKIYDSVFKRLSMPKVNLRINNRQILDGISQLMNLESVNEIAPVLDKSDKIGYEGVIKKLTEKNISDSSINQLKFFLELNGSNQDKINSIKTKFISNNISIDGVDLLEKIINTSQKFNLNNVNLIFDLSLARGLSYYTGTIIEVSSPDEFNIGSIGGGGRYDNLVQENNPRLSGFGISFGFDRICLILDELNLFPNELDSSKSFLFLNFGLDKIDKLLIFIDKIRQKNIACEIYPYDNKIKKQMDYANQKGINYVVIIGEDELKNSIFKIKDMSNGVESKFNLNNIVSEIEKLS
ncbi:histidine--tRNA ligase [Flavobacteriaceae bacterium]|jgi:histidyl-tRNA synthetase|nr:histidine--tRNA ligase [Flavobacteriaceae bacterium]MDC3219355.1 histidine--tRNA ligase [Flavobacteriaceae bacterium]